MVRPFLALAAGLLGLHGALTAARPTAARPQEPRQWAVVMVKDAKGKVDGARGVLMQDPRPDLPAVGSLLHFDPLLGSDESLLWAQPSRQTGMLRWQFRGPARAGPAWISAEGVAILLPRLMPGDAQRTTLVPEGAISTATGDRTCTLFATALVDGQRIQIPALRGTRFPLPPATYEAWIDIGDEIYWQRFVVLSGVTCTIDLGGPAQVVQRGGGATVIPAGRGDLFLLGPDRERCVLRGEAITAPLTTFVPSTGLVMAEQTIAAPPGNQPMVWPAAATVKANPPVEIPVALPGGAEPRSVRAFLLRRNAFGRWRLRGTNAVDEDGTLRLPRLQGGDDWLLIAAPDHPPFALPVTEIADHQPLVIPPGLPLVVTCRLQGGDPARDVRLEYVPHHAEVATIAVHTDRRGRADFGRVTGPGTVRTSDARYANIEARLEAIPDDGVRLTLPPGFEVRGVVQLPDGTGASGVTVTLRAPHEGLRPRERSTITGADGSFQLGGLTENHEYILFATTRRINRTWSSKVRRFTASPKTLTLTIRNEDPHLAPDKR